MPKAYGGKGEKKVNQMEMRNWLNLDLPSNEIGALG